MLEVVVLPWVPETAIVGLQPRELAEQVGAVQLGRAGGALGVLRRDRGGVDDLGARRDVVGVVAVGLDPGGAQARG